MSVEYKKIVCKKLGTNFKECTEIVSVPLKAPSDSQIVVRMSSVGINASDINFTSGHYTPGAASRIPFDCGFEGIGTVTAVGAQLASKFSPGDLVYVMKYGCFSEYVFADAKSAYKIPSMDSAFLALMTSGLTASVALTEAGSLKQGQTVLVTAAAGGTGQFAVQLAKLAGCTVIGTCSSEEKVKFLKSLGCDRAINYKTEDLDQVLTKEYPRGVDLVYESVGGATFDVCVKNLAIGGRLLVIGAVSQYQDQSAWDTSKGSKNNQASVPLASTLLKKSATVSGFFLLHYSRFFPTHSQKLFKLYMNGKITAGVDSHQFVGLNQVNDAIQYMYEGRNAGKVVVQLPLASKL